MKLRARIEPLDRALARDVDLFVMPAEKIRALSHGEVKKPETLNYHTSKPEKQGLLCDDIFGDVDDKIARATRLGRITLATPVVHPLLEEALAEELGWSVADLRATAYCERDIDSGMGAAAIAKLGTFEALITVLPVSPPALRPMVKLDGGRWATTDVTDLYRRVVNRNNRLARLTELNAPEIILRNEARMLQSAVETLFDNERRPKKVFAPERRVLTSLLTEAVRLLEKNQHVDAALAALCFSIKDEGSI